ncbi:MAG: DoxX family protein [Opitutales bacterium]|nr:DoxX family protein [Opitutales bacterium]NRA26849.1 DoxX family protein [Opitutales bacterium]
MSRVKSILFGGQTGLPLLTDLSLTVFRVFVGLTMALAHGWGKTPPSEGFINRTGEMGFPFPTLFAWSASLSELVGGALLAIGLLSRPSAFFLTITLGVAAFIAHGDDIFGGNFKGGEKALLFFMANLMYTCVGSGRFSIDALIRK